MILAIASEDGQVEIYTLAEEEKGKVVNSLKLQHSIKDYGIQPIRTSVVTNIKHSEEYFQSRALMTEISRVSPCSSYLGAPQSRNKLNILSSGTLSGGRIMTET
jgi:hypothetical protein